MAPHRRQASQYGSGAATVTPEFIGQIYLDTSNNELYYADGTSSSADWVPFEDAVGGTGLRKIVDYTVVSPEVWQASTTYIVGDEVIPATGYTRFKYTVTSAGTSGSSEPSWDTQEGGGNTNDGSVSWNTSVDGLDEIGFSNLDINERFEWVCEEIERYPSLVL